MVAIDHVACAGRDITSVVVKNGEVSLAIGGVGNARFQVESMLLGGTADRDLTSLVGELLLALQSGEQARTQAILSSFARIRYAYRAMLGLLLSVIVLMPLIHFALGWQLGAQLAVFLGTSASGVAIVQCFTWYERRAGKRWKTSA